MENHLYLLYFKQKHAIYEEKWVRGYTSVPTFQLIPENKIIAIFTNLTLERLANEQIRQKVLKNCKYLKNRKKFEKD